ncbi:MAG TPA: hypothetical protein VMD30_07475 [Tepidisphaeraceae bacterium]|nr:hypothetical protein [Tepidisphaeraceae bacterium]
MKRWLIIGTEILLVVVILALLTAIWLPALIGAHPNSANWP